MFVEVLAVTRKGAAYNEAVRNWGVAATVMIGAGYYGETSVAGSNEYWTGFVIAMATYIWLMRNLQAEGEGLKGDEAAAFENIKKFILWDTLHLLQETSMLLEKFYTQSLT